MINSLSEIWFAIFDLTLSPGKHWGNQPASPRWRLGRAGPERTKWHEALVWDAFNAVAGLKSKAA
jgi:hypothetical protein